MNLETVTFLEELKSSPNVLGVILFGSWARGNNRPNSDVDLIVICKEGYKRTVEFRNTQAFEIIYITAESAFQFWEQHKDDAAGLFEVAQILFDRDGSVAILRDRALKMLSAGKPEIDEFRLKQMRFDIEDQLRYVESIIVSDMLSASLILNNCVTTLTGIFFDLRRQWIPGPKQRIAKLRELDPELVKLLGNLYSGEQTITKKLASYARLV